MKPYFETPDGAVRIFRGEALTTLLELDDDSADALITDPPYSSGGFTRGDRTAQPAKKYVSTHVKLERLGFQGDNRDQRGFAYWCTLWLWQSLRILRAGSPVLHFADWRQAPMVSDLLQSGGFVYRGIVPWDKTFRCRKVQGRFASQAEFVVWGSKGPMPLNRNVRPLRGVFTVPVDSNEKEHMTGKPIALMRQLVEIVEPGGLVLDPFAGSGTTLLAARELGLRAIGIEAEEENCAIAARLLSQQVMPLARPPVPDLEQSTMLGDGDVA